MKYEENARACQTYILENLDKDLSLESISKHLNLSPTYLRNCFQKYAHVSISKYIQNMRIARAAHDLIYRLCIVSEAAQISGFSSIYSFSKTFHKVLGVAPSKYIGAVDLPIIKITLPTTVAGYILHRAEDGHSGLALWHGYDFSKCNENDFNVASPEGGAEVGIWTEIDGDQCYLFGVTCRPDATIPAGMVLHTLPPVTWAMFPVPAGGDAHELYENLNAVLGLSIEYCDEAATYEPLSGQPVMEYYHGNETYLCIPVRERRK